MWTSQRVPSGWLGEVCLRMDQRDHKLGVVEVLMKWHLKVLEERKIGVVEVVEVARKEEDTGCVNVLKPAPMRIDVDLVHPLARRSIFITTPSRIRLSALPSYIIPKSLRLMLNSRAQRTAVSS